MKRILILMAAGICSAIGAMAQTSFTRTIRGVVVDQDGNPIPGAEVSAKGGAEITVTDSDGSFKLEISRYLKRVSARYAGMYEKSLKPQFYGTMVFRMHPAIYGKPAWFVNVTGGSNFKNCTQIGLMAGRYGKWGYYLKAGYYRSTEYDYGYDEDYYSAGPLISAGAIKQIYSPLYCYLGGGAYYDTYENDIIPVFDFGLMLRMGKHFNATAGVSLDFDVKAMLNIGIGYVF